MSMWCKEYRQCKKIIVEILAHVFVRMVELLAEVLPIADTSVFVHDEIINAADRVSGNMTSIVPTNMINTV